MHKNKNNEELPQWLQVLLVIGGAVCLGYLLTKLFEFLFDTWGEDEVRPRVFISHSWSYDNDYWNLIGKFQKNEFEFYNHSIDLDKPLDASTKSEIELGIRNKIKGCSKVVVLAGSYAERYWIKREVEIANEMGKEIIAVRPWGQSYVPPFLNKKADKIVGFNSKSIIEHIKS